MRNYGKVSLSILDYTITLIIAAIVLFPIVWLILSAFKTRADVYSYSLFFRPTFDNFAKVLFYPRNFLHNIINSFLVAGIATLVGIGISFPAAYGFSRFPIRGKDNMLFYIISMQFIPPVVVLIPFYLFF